MKGGETMEKDLCLLCVHWNADRDMCEYAFWGATDYFDENDKTGRVYKCDDYKEE